MSKTRIPLLLLIFLLFYSYTGMSQDSGLLKAAFLMEQERFKDAFNLLDSLSPPFQEETIYYQLLGASAYEIGEYDVALNAFENQAGSGESGLAQYHMARIYFLTNQEVSGYEALRHYYESDKHISIKEILADQAFENYVKDREWIRFWSNFTYSDKDDLLAEANAQIGQAEPEMEIFEQLQTRYPNEPNTWSLSGKYFQLTGNQIKAEDYYRKAIELSPESTNRINLLASYLSESKKFNESSAWIRKSLRLNPYQPALLMLNVYNLQQAGDNQAALAQMQELESIGVENLDLWTSLAQQIMKTDLPAAIKLLNRVINQKPLHITALNSRATMYLANQEIDFALADWALSLDIDPHQANVYFLRAQVRYDSGDREGACYDWKKALRNGHRKALDKLYKYCE